MRHVILIPDLESGGYTVEVPSLPGCISEGDTVEESLENIKNAIIVFEAALRDIGREVPQESVPIL